MTETRTMPATASGKGYTPKLYTDVAELIARGPIEPPAPTCGLRRDGVGLIYRGHVNSFVGDPESGKTLLAQAIAADEMFVGGSVLLVDLDHNGAEATISRMLSFGIKPEVLSDPARFRYTEPEDPTEIAGIIEDAKIWQPSFVLIDSVGELLPIYAANSNNPDDFTRVHAAAIKPFAMAGACVVIIDHLAKGLQSRSYGATGTGAKKRAISGTMLRITVDEAFTPGAGGKSEIVILKDRHGGLRANSPRGKEPLAARFRLVDREGALTWYLDAPGENEQPRVSGNTGGEDVTELVRILSELTPPPASVRDVKGRCKWGTEKASLAWAAWQTARSNAGMEVAA
ncbi:hypothetical protein [Microbacterium sp. ZW T5_56]|uniref:hypothetical protein n=1 Tax=Microbacterium sp. ZW T5_56 TaxID=3378081 RepID=UPI003854D878